MDVKSFSNALLLLHEPLQYGRELADSVHPKRAFDLVDSLRFLQGVLFQGAAKPLGVEPNPLKRVSCIQAMSFEVEGRVCHLTGNVFECRGEHSEESCVPWLDGDIAEECGPSFFKHRELSVGCQPMGRCLVHCRWITRALELGPSRFQPRD